MTDERKREILEWMYRHGIKPEGVMATNDPRALPKPNSESREPND